MRISIIITALSIANPAWTQPAPVRKGEKVKLAPAVVPQIFTATAAEKDGKVVVRMSAPALRLMAKKIGGKTAVAIDFKSGANMVWCFSGNGG